MGIGAAPVGLNSLFSLPTLPGFADARLQGGLNNVAPAALGSGFFGPRDTFATEEVSQSWSCSGAGPSPSVAHQGSPRWDSGWHARGGEYFDSDRVL